MKANRRFHKGDKVRHPVFGEGTVERVPNSQYVWATYGKDTRVDEAELLQLVETWQDVELARYFEKLGTNPMPVTVVSTPHRQFGTAV